MAVIRTSISLIGFGFTIFQFFLHLHETHPNVSHRIPKIFGVALVLLGIANLVIGISYHIRLMIQKREEREILMQDALLPTIDKFPISMTLIIAFLLLIIGVSAITTMLFQIV